MTSTGRWACAPRGSTGSGNNSTGEGQEGRRETYHEMTESKRGELGVLETIESQEGYYVAFCRLDKMKPGGKREKTRR